MTEPRRYERIDVELPCRLYVPGERGLKFEAHCTSRNLGLGGVFLSSSFLLREGLELFVELGLPGGPLAIRARVAHAVPGDHPELEGGFGVEFLDVDAAGRETLLRYFTPLRYHEFYRAFAGEFPHLRDRVPVADVALLLNLWEEWKVLGEGGVAFTASGAPPAPARAGAGPARRGRRS